MSTIDGTEPRNIFTHILIHSCRSYSHKTSYYMPTKTLLCVVGLGPLRLLVHFEITLYLWSSEHYLSLVGLSAYLVVLRLCALRSDIFTANEDRAAFP